MAKVHLAFGTACNFNCSYCFEKNKSNVVAIEDCKRVIDALFTKLKPKDVALFSISEPFYNLKMFWELYNYLIEDKGMNPWEISFLTNGSLLDVENHLDDYKKRGYVIISIDGKLETQSKHRSSLHYDTIINNIKLLVSNNIKVIASMVVKPDEYDIFENANYLLSLGIDKIILNAERKLNYTDEELGIIENKFSEFYEKLYDEISSENYEGIYRFQLGNSLIYLNDMGINIECYGCHKYHSNDLITIDINGNVYNCDYEVSLKNSIANIFEDNFKLPNVFKGYSKSESCKSCKWHTICPTINYFCDKMDPRVSCILRKVEYEYCEKIKLLLDKKFGKNNYGILCNNELIYKLEQSYRTNKILFNKWIKYFPHYKNLIIEQAKVKK